MQPITMSQFVDYVLTSGTSKLTAAKRIVNQGANEQVSDFYRPIREAIVEMHRTGLDTVVLDDLLASLVDKREQLLFFKVASGYKKFLQQGKMIWFEPPMRNYSLGSIDIRIAPELGLLIDRRPYVVKLYFRGEPIDPQRVMITNQLLTNALSTTWPGTVFSVLDVRRARLHGYRPKSEVGLLLKAEAMHLAHILGSI